MTSIQQHSPLLLGVVICVCFILVVKLVSQKNRLSELENDVQTLEKTKQDLEAVVAEQAATITQVQKQQSTTQSQHSDSLSEQNKTATQNNHARFDEALIDINVGVKRVRGKEERYQSLLEEFIHREPNLVTQLTEFVGKSNMLEAKEFAHSMKEATGDLALDSLHFCLEDLENALIEDDLAAIHQKLVDLGRAWRITEREVQKYLNIKSA